MRGSKAASLASASLRVASSIQLLLAIRSPIGGADVADQLGHLALAFGRVVALDVDLADGSPSAPSTRPTPRFQRSRCSGTPCSVLRIEVEARVVERLGQELRVVADETEGEPVLPRLQRHRCEQLARACDRASARATIDLLGTCRGPAWRASRSHSNCGASLRAAGRGSSGCRSRRCRGVAPASTATFDSAVSSAMMRSARGFGSPSSPASFWMVTINRDRRRGSASYLAPSQQIIFAAGQAEPAWLATDRVARRVLESGSMPMPTGLAKPGLTNRSRAAGRGFRRIDLGRYTA